MNQINSEEISLKELILKTNEYFSYFKNKKFFILMIIGVFVLYFGFSAHFAKTYYKAERKFFLEGDRSSTKGFGGLLGQIGIGGSRSNPYQVLEVANSKALLSKVIFKRINNEEFIGNVVIDKYNLNEIWGKGKEKYQPFYFTHDSIDTFNAAEKNVLLQIINIIEVNGKEAPLKSILYDEDKAIFTIKTETVDENLTLGLNESLYKEIKQYYDLQAVEGLRQTRDMLKVKLDSLERNLKGMYYQLGRFGDQSQGLVSLEKQSQRDIIQLNINKLILASSEINKMYEIADYNYLNQKPGFILVEKPFTPLIPQNKNLIMEVIKGTVFGLFISLFLLFLLKTYNDVMKD